MNLNISGGASNNQPKPKVTTPEESPKTSTPSGQTTIAIVPGQQSISPPGPSEAEKEAYRKDVMDSYTYGSGYYERAGDAYDPAKVKAAMEARDRDKRIADYRHKHGFAKGGLVRFFKAGRVSTTTGHDIKGGVMGADTQYTPPMALKPGEDMYIIPSQAAPYMDKMVAKFDRNSNPAKNQGNLKKSGPSVSFMDLPPNIIGSPKMSGGDSQPGKPEIPDIDVKMSTSKRMEIAVHLGIEDLV